VEFVPQAQARRSSSPPSRRHAADVAQVWDNWVGEFDGMNAVEDLTPK